jgi:hypothetical protein
MKAYWVSGGIAPRILDLGTRLRWVVSFTPRPLYPRERASGTHWIGGWVGLRAGLIPHILAIRSGKHKPSWWMGGQQSFCFSFNTNCTEFLPIAVYVNRHVSSRNTWHLRFRRGTQFGRQWVIKKYSSEACPQVLMSCIYTAPIGKNWEAVRWWRHVPAPNKLWTCGWSFVTLPWTSCL